MRKKQTLNKSQKKRIIKWDIPHLLYLLENRYSVSALHLMTPDFSSKGGYLVFNGKTGFPLLMGKDFFGVLVVLRALEMEQALSVREFIDDYFQKLFLYRGGIEKIESFRASPFSLENAKRQSKNTSLCGSAPSLLVKAGSKPRGDIYSKIYFSSEENKKLSTDPFPLLLQRKKRECLLKEAHDIYLKTKAFAFLSTEDLKWENGVFQKMEDVFLCVPSFSGLSLFQKEVLIQSLLKKELPGPLVVGIHKEEELPLKWQKLFPAIL
ncbi:MAG: hypothetical protein OXM55_05765 [Bdellovibrionales bacterium]|nr:hypothetical protein [Bdellovibrionales bacterium]